MTVLSWRAGAGAFAPGVVFVSLSGVSLAGFWSDLGFCPSGEAGSGGTGGRNGRSDGAAGYGVGTPLIGGRNGREDIPENHNEGSPAKPAPAGGRRTRSGNWEQWLK